MSAIGRHVSKLTGYAPALPTPFGADGDIDIPAFERLCDLQLAHGATALIVCGTTGEAPTLTPEEHRLLIQIAAAQTRGRIPLIAGASANATAHAIELARDAEAAGADAVLSVVPYYNKPVQAGCTLTFGRSRNRQGCQLFSMTCRREQHVVFQIIRSHGWPSCRASLGLECGRRYESVLDHSRGVRSVGRDRATFLRRRAVKCRQLFLARPVDGLPRSRPPILGRARQGASPARQARFRSSSCSGNLQAAGSRVQSATCRCSIYRAFLRPW
jgi:hypothetical protein